MASNWRIQLKHIWREANATVNYMAKLGSTGTVTWHEFLLPPLMKLNWFCSRMHLGLR